ncbi:MAG TPA: carbohydrate ABC transporter permease [Clostridia bacterium]|jgi:putative aldouronate transport system permease protein
MIASVGLKKKKRIKKMHAFDYFNYIILGLFALITLYPFWYVLIGSFNNGQDFSGGGIWLWPRVFTTANYRVVFADDRLWLGFRNTVLKTVIGVITSLTFTSCTAYGLSSSKLRFKKVFHWINLFTMFFSGGLIPYFMVISMIGLYDNFLVYVIPSIYSVYNMLVMSSFFKSIPNDINEAAVIDGAREFTIWWKIYVPLSKPCLATIGLWIAVGHWNSYLGTMLYTQGTDLLTLQYYLVKLIKQASVPVLEGDLGQIQKETSATTISFAAIVISTIPIFTLYPFIQKYFSKGIMIGSLKG